MAGELGGMEGLGHPDIRAGRDALLAGRDLFVNNYLLGNAEDLPGPAEPGSAREYLTLLAESYQWLELQGIREAGSLRVELEKVYVALSAEPETDYDLRHLAELHTLEVSEAAGGTALDLIEPTRLAALDAENVRRTYRPLREEARLAGNTEVQNIADAFRGHSRMVLLGGPGSGKTTLGRWLALQLARGLLRQLPHQVPPQPGPEPADVPRIHVPLNTTVSFARSHFVAPAEAEVYNSIRIDRLPTRGRLTAFGRPARRGEVIGLDQVERLTFTPAENECGSGYAHLRFRLGGGKGPARSGAVAIDVGRHILVPLSQIDPDQPGGAESERLVDLGPARMPIFLRLAHFARELAERERGQKPALSLEDYLGRDPDSCGRADGCTPQSRNALLRGFLERGDAVVILDGLDELPEANRRTVSLKIQDFIEKTTRPNAQDPADEPWQAGGNQVLVTSRYVGYKLMPVRSGCKHFGIQPMRRPAVEHFARAWTRAVSAELGAVRTRRPDAEALIGEIYDDARPAIRELATNPLLVTILATVYWADGHLPDQRAGVYDRVVENLLGIWLSRPECRAQQLGRDMLLAALEPLAAEMQEDHASNGLIGLDRIAELVEGPLAEMRGTTPAARAFRPVLEALLTTIRKHVGLLAEQSSGNYAFFHRTFQEFLAARHLLSDREHAAERIVERLEDPLWREPLLLALGLVTASSEWGGPEARTRLLEDVLAADRRDPLIPRAAMLVVSAVPNLDNLPRPVIDRIVGQLIACYAFSQRQPQAERLRYGICEVFEQLRDGPRAELVAEAVCETIRRSETVQDAAAAAQILLRTDWFTTGAVDALLQFVHQDSADLGWPVHWAVLASLARSAQDRAPSRLSPELDVARLVLGHLPMRRLLEASPELTAFVRGDVDWLWLLVALYGGLGRVGVRERLQTHQKLRLAHLRPGPDDPQAAPAGAPPSIPPLEFRPGDIVHDLADPELSRILLRALKARRPGAELAGTLRRIWERGEDPAGSAEALVGLAALGHDVVPLVRAAQADPARRAAAREALERFRWLRALLREPLIRLTETAARTLPDGIGEQRQLDLLRIVIAGRAAAGGDPLPVSDAVPALRYVEAACDPVRDALDAEGWVYLFSGLTGGPGDPIGALLGPPDAGLPRGIGRLARGWPQLPQARNHLTRLRLPWPQLVLGPRCDTPVERYLAMLDGLLLSPPGRDYPAGRLLGRCTPALTEHPELIWETLAVCCLRGQDFVKGYLAGATGDRAFALACSSLTAELVGLWDDGGRLGPEAAEELRGAVEAILARKADGVPVIGRAAVKAGLTVLLHAVRIGEPYLRFRALWRLSGVVDREAAVPMLLNVSELLDGIEDPHDHARAVEWIMMTIPDAQSGLAVGELFAHQDPVELFARIEDPENRARAQYRLALLAPERLEDLLEAAAGSLGRIADPVRRAEAVGDVRATLGRVAGLTPALDAVAEALPEDWLRDKAFGRTSRLLAEYWTRYGAGALAWRLPPLDGAGGASRVHRHRYPTGLLAWGALYLDATALEVGELGATPTGDAADWELLLGPAWEAGVDALIESATDGALRLTAREASVLNRIVQSGRSAVLERLWGYLECPDAQAMAIAVRWTAADEPAERWKALVQAEAGHLTPENVDRLVELMSESTDRLRLRSALALHGPRPYDHNRNRRWTPARVGAETIEALSRQAGRDDYPPPISSALSWVQSDIHHDDAEALGRWIADAAEPGSPAQWIIKRLESMDDALLPPLLEALPSAPPEAQRLMLFGLSRLAHTHQVLESAPEAVRAAIASVPTQVRREVRCVPNAAVACLKAAEEAAACPDEEERLEIARGAIERAAVWLDDASLADWPSCISRLKAMGATYYVHRGANGGWTEAGGTAPELAENEDALRLMLAWVESLRFEEDEFALAGDLLSATDALARVSPNAFTVLAEPDVWEPILIEFVETGTHWTARVAAVRMLGLLRRVSGRVAVALRTAMNDIALVQEAAYQATEEFRSMRGDVTPELLRLLEDPCAGVAASTARLLVSLARSESATTDRRRILRGLQDAAAGSAKDRNVYLMPEHEEGGFWIQFVDRLDQILYQAVFQVSGL